MKKSLFLLASLGAFVVSRAQTLYVAPDTQVKVKSGALLYVDGSAKVADYTRTRDNSKFEYMGLDKKVSNEGNVHITGGLTNGTNSAQGFNFVNELLPNGKYGQLIVDGTATNTGKITAELLLNKDFGYYSMAFPFTDGVNAFALASLYGYKITGNFQGITTELPGYKPKYLGFDPKRYTNPMFVFNYTSGEEGQALDQLLRSDKLEPGKYYAFNVKYNTLGETLPNGKTLDSKKFPYSFVQGTPNNKETSITVYPYTISNNKDANKYGEQFGSYIIDFTQNMPKGFNKYGEGDAVVEAGDFGSNIFLFGNPFTSNINLLADDDSGFKDATAIVQFTQETHYDQAVNDYNGANKNGTHSDAYGTVMTAITGDGVGNSATKIVRPYQTFAIKCPISGSSKIFKFTDKMKTFDAPSDATNVVLDMPEAARSEKAQGIAKNQLGLDLYDNNGFTGVQTYVVASDIYEAAKKGKGIELTNTTVKKDNTSLYTLQENEDGSTIDDKAYINGVNADKYVGKPIHLVLQNAKGQYTIKGDLNEDLSNNKNAFYFEDKKTGKVVKVGKDFSYTFNAEGTDKDRFVLYWAKTPKAELSKDLAKEVKSSSVVYKDAAGTYRVRFDRAIKKADVFVYNISGQLVNVAKAVDTANDYVVPVKGNSSIYVVKIVGDNGSVTTKKIIK